MSYIGSAPLPPDLPLHRQIEKLIYTDLLIHKHTHIRHTETHTDKHTHKASHTYPRHTYTFTQTYPLNKGKLLCSHTTWRHTTWRQQLSPISIRNIRFSLESNLLLVWKGISMVLKWNGQLLYSLGWRHLTNPKNLGSLENCCQRPRWNPAQ